MTYVNWAVLIGQGRSQSMGIKTKPGFPWRVDTERTWLQGAVWEPRVWSEVVTDGCERPSSAKGCSALTICKFRPSADQEECLSMDEILLGVHVKWIFRRGGISNRAVTCRAGSEPLFPLFLLSLPIVDIEWLH